MIIVPGVAGNGNIRALFSPYPQRTPSSWQKTKNRRDAMADYSTPLVLGTPVIRGSDSKAARRARAADLKMPSAM